MKKISIIIVNYNTSDLLLRCLNSINAYVKVDHEVIIVDNASTDCSITLCKSILEDNKYKLYNSAENLGFAKANNIGVRLSNGNILHFLNPDTELCENINDDYIYVLNNFHNVYVNDLKNLDGTFVQSKNLIPTLDNYFKRLFLPESSQYWYTGATVIISRDNFDKIGGWNECYFMYSEDLDLFYNINKYKIPVKKLNSVITHVGGGSSSKVWTNFSRECKVQKSFKDFFRNNKIYWQYPFIIISIFIYQLLKNPQKAFFFLHVCLKIR